MKHISHFTPEKIFIILGLLFGITFLVINPPFQGADECIHFGKAIDISEGHIIPKKIGNNAGFTIPTNLQTISWKFPWDNDNYHKKFKISSTFSALNVRYNYESKNFVDVSDVAIITYPPFPYLAPSFVILIGKSINLPPLILMYLGRLACLLTWLFLTYLAIKITPVHKWSFLMLALMPTALFGASTISADSFTIGIAFLVVALFLKLSYDENKKEITIKDIFILLLLLSILTLSKPFYFIVALLFFIIPLNKFRNKKNMFFSILTIFLITTLIGFIWYYYSKSLYMPENIHASIPKQLSFILSSPLRFLHIIIISLLNNIKDYINGFVGKLGWSLLLPLWMNIVYLITLFIISFLDKKRFNIDYKQKIMILVILIIISILIFIVEYLAWTSVGQNIIIGVQGRYFLPIAPLLFLLVYNSFNSLNKIKIGPSHEIYFCSLIILLIITFLSASVYALLDKFYI